MRDEIEREADRLDAFIRQQQRRCRVSHRGRPDYLRIHPRDYETLMLDRRYIARWSATEEWYRNMRMHVDTEAIDGPIVECPIFWEHGRVVPRGFVASQSPGKSRTGRPASDGGGS